jgi:hypothetical protein
MPVNAAQTPVRYGAFPSATTWYVSAGQWPSNNNDDSSDRTSRKFKQITGRLARTMDANGKISSRWNSVVPERRRAPVKNVRGNKHRDSAMSEIGATSPYEAQLLKTTDGGKTFQSLMYNQNKYYFNGIDCSTVDNCCVTAENDDSTAYAGAYIFCTNDSGKTWNQAYRNATVGMSLLDLRSVGATGYVAVGGIITSFPVAATFLYSPDQGKTWLPDGEIAGQYATSVDCTSSTAECWATTVDALQTSNVAYTAKL